MKLEGGRPIAEIVATARRGRHPGDGPPRPAAAVGAPVGGYQCRPLTRATAKRWSTKRYALEQAGAFAVVLEAMPAELARKRDQRRWHPDDRHRRRARLRRPGAGLLRHAGPLRPVRAAVRQAVRRPGRRRSTAAAAAYVDEVRDGPLSPDARALEPLALTRARHPMTPRGRSRRIADVHASSRGRASAPARIGLVPTMGALHAGHLSLDRDGPRRVRASSSASSSTRRSSTAPTTRRATRAPRGRPRAAASGGRRRRVRAGVSRDVSDADRTCTVEVGALADHCAARTGPGTSRAWRRSC